MSLGLDGRWLTATVMPVGFMLSPGPFDRWRDVLTALRVVVRSLKDDSPVESAR